MTRFGAVIAATLCIGSTAAAHPGHGAPVEAWSLAHHLIEPIHVVPMLLVLVVAGSIASLLRHRRGAVRRLG